MKKFKKITTVVCVAMLITSALAGCKTKETSNEASEKTFTYWVTMDGNTSITQKSFADLLIYQEMEKRSGIKIEFVHPIAGSTGSEAFLTMLTSSDRPDMIEYDWSGYTGGPQQAIDDEVIISLNDHMKEFAPNYYDYMEGEKGKANNYLYKLQSVTEKGAYYGFNGLSIGTSRVFQGLFVRQDKLNEWGMDVPVTIDDWTAVFAKAKSEGFDKPFSATPWTFNNMHGAQTFNAAYGVSRGFYVEDNKVKFAPFEAGFKDYLNQLNQWSKAGYIDSGFVTGDEARLTGNILNNISVAGWYYISTIGEMNMIGKESNPEFSLVACPLPILKDGDIVKFADVAGESSSLAIGISSTCQNIEAAMKWCDYLYSDEGSTLRTFGIEGDTYTIEESGGEKHFVYTDKIVNYKEHGHNPINEALYKYVLPANHPGLNQHPDYLMGYYQEQCQRDALELWNQNNDEAKLCVLPSLSYTKEELREKTDILEVTEHILESALSDIILGKKDISHYDVAIKNAKENGMEKLITIHQAAYDRYIANMK